MFTQMVDIIPEGSCGIAKVTHRTPNRLSIMRAAWHGELLEERPMATLFVNEKMVMSDGPEEHRSNYYMVHKARGRVLIAGLGIGMILVPLIKKEEVTSILVVEKYQDVINLIAPYHQSPKLQCVCADIFKWKPSKGTKFDTIYFDIWPDICSDNLDDISRLHQKFKYFKAKGGWMESWNQDLLRYNRRNGR